jgi:hypothetical protein
LSAYNFSDDKDKRSGGLLINAELSRVKVSEYLEVQLCRHLKSAQLSRYKINRFDPDYRNNVENGNNVGIPRTEAPSSTLTG